MQDLNDMLFFAEVVDRGGFTAAGRALHVPKSRLSRRIAELEDRLGVRLLHRTTRKLSLTEAGQIYHGHCVAMREQAQAADEALATVRAAPSGTVRVTCPVTLAQTTIGPLLPRFLAAYPQVRIDMQVSNRVVDLVQEGIDIALRVRSSVEDSASLIVKNLGPTRGILTGSPAVLQRLGAPVRPDDLRGLPTVAMSAADGTARWTLRGPRGEAYEWTHRPVFTADDLLTLKSAALEGTGVSVLPDYLCADELASGRLVPVLPGWAPPEARVLAVFPSRRGMVPAVRSLLDFLGENVCGERILHSALAPAARFRGSPLKGTVGDGHLKRAPETAGRVLASKKGRTA